MQLGPKLVLGDAGPERRPHVCDRDVAHVHRQPEALDFLRCLERSRELERCLRVEQLYAGPLEPLRTPGFAPVDREAAIAASVPPDEVDDGARPEGALLLDARSREEVEPRRAGLERIDGFDARADVPRGPELEQHHRTVGQDERIPSRRVRGPDRHVPGASRVTDVDRVGEQRTRVVEPCELGPQLCEAALTEPLLVYGGPSGLDVQRGRAGARADFRVARPSHGAAHSPARVRRGRCLSGSQWLASGISDLRRAMKSRSPSSGPASMAGASYCSSIERQRREARRTMSSEPSSTHCS